ncbi:MAG: hypothetical protein EP326_03470 [Deltaproteobacteria bacterium]|nr:MAG: hypothetical protein EP326_03470 [Deltaproteobacteria bacterium]
MRFSNIIKFLAMIIVGQMLYGCSAGVDENVNTDSPQSNLIVSSLNASSIQEVFENAATVTRPTHKTFMVTVCLKESVLLDPIRNQQFSINTKTPKTTVSDANGCLRWTEKVEMKASFHNRYVLFNRTITTSGQFSGTLNIKYAFNMFTNNFVDLQHEPLPEDQLITAGKEDMEVDFDMTDLTIYFGGYDTQHDDSRANKRVITKWIGCFKIKADMSAVSSQIIEMKVLDENGDVVQEVVNKTDLKGCLRANIYTEYDQFQATRWIPRRLVVQAVDGPLKGQILNRDIYINPWVNGRNHGWDSRAGEPPQNPVGEKAKLHLDSVRYTFLGNKEEGYKVNKYLDLSVAKSYLIELAPKINRGHSYSTNRIIEDIYTGYFILKVSILAATKGATELTAENIDQFKFISGTQKEVEVINNKILTTIDLPFRFDQLAESAARTIAVLELTPKDPEAFNLQPVIVSGKFLASTHQLSVGLRPHDRDLIAQSELNITNDILRQKLNPISALMKAAALESKWQGSPSDIFTELHKDNPLKQEDIKTLKRSKSSLVLVEDQITEADFNSLLDDPNKKELLGKVCSYFFPKVLVEGILWDSYNFPAEYHGCKRNPSRYIKGTGLKHIEEITGKPQKLFTSTDKIGIGTGFLIYSGESRRTSVSKRISFGGGLSAKLEIPFLKILSLGAGVNADIAKVWSRDESQGTTSRAQFSRSRNLFVDELKLGFEASINNCVLFEGVEYEVVKPAPYYGMGMGFGGYNNIQTEKKLNKKRLRICKDKTQKEWIEESWYYVGEQKPSDSVIRDPWSISENYLGKIIRGKDNYELFYNLMTDDTKVIYLEKIDQLPSNTAMMERYYKNDTVPVLEDMAIPGTIKL